MTKTDESKNKREALSEAIHEWRDESGVFSLEEGVMSGLEMKLPWARDPELAGSAI